jgi:threonine synthase
MTATRDPAVVTTDSMPAVARTVLVLDLAANESGSHKLRAAIGIIAAAVRDGHRQVAAGSCGNYGLAVAIAARDAGIDATVTLPSGWGDEGAAIRSLGARVELVDGGYEDAVAASKRTATRTGSADANVDGPYAASGTLALSSITDDLADVLAQPPAVIWVPLGNGTTLAALHAGIARRGWPTTLVGVSSAGNNSILASWPGNTQALLDPATLRETEANEPLVNWAALHGDEALAALHATRGAAIGVSDMTLLAGRDALAAVGMPATPAGAAGIAGLMSAAGEPARRPGVHVALVTGRPWEARL